MLEYRDIENRSWQQILRDDFGGFTPALSVHVPIQPVHSPDFVHVDCGLNACRRRVFPDLTSTDAASCEAANRHETFLVEFALDDPPFVPDPQLSTMRLAEGRYPVVTADYFAWDLYYRFEYCCRAIDEGQSILRIRATVRNEGEAAQQAHIRAKVNFQRECDLFDYHYVPFSWDRTRWPECDAVSLEGSRLLKESRPIGRVAGQGLAVEWQESVAIDPQGYRRKFGCGSPYLPLPHQRFERLRDVLHARGEVAPGEESSFEIALLVNFERIRPEHLEALDAASFEDDRDAALEHFRSAACAGAATMQFPAAGWEEFFAALPISSQQLLVDFPGREDLMPTQGGTSERHFVWIWEAVFLLRPLLRLGHFEPVKRAMEFFFRLQDGGFPPEGEFTSLEGAIGTTGLRWANSTGSALALAAEYFLYQRDEELLKSYLPKIERAMDWIVGEIRATRVAEPDGSKSPVYGLMPFACSTDGDTGYIVGFTDAYTFWGLEKAVRMFEAVGHARAGEFRDELQQYRRAIDAAIEYMTEPSGFIDRKILLRDPSQGKITRKFDHICCANQFILTGNLDVSSEAFRRFTEYFEQHHMQGPFAGVMDREVCYMGTGEYSWFYAYLRRGEWKKAFLAMRANQLYGKTRDTHQVQERFSRRNPAYTPWQPNGSGNGRMLDMMLDAIWYEFGGTATLLGAVPFAWLIENGLTALRGLHTERGRLDIEIRAAGPSRCEVTICGENERTLPGRVRVPGHFAVRWQTPGVSEADDGLYELPAGTRELTLTLSDNESLSGETP